MIDKEEIRSKKEIFLKIYKYVLDQIKDPIFAIALGVAIFMWFLNSLAGEFTTVISVPIHLIGAVDVIDEDNKESVDNKFSVDCKVSGKGYRILYYNIFSKLNINTADVIVEKSSTGEYVVNMTSLENKMNEEFDGITLINLFQKRIAFRTLTYGRKEVPIQLDVNVKNDGQYMQIGEALLEPAFVSLSGNLSKLNTVNKVSTKHINITNNAGTISGEIELQDIPDVSMNLKKIYYSLSFQRFTELKIMKKIEVKNNDGARYSVIPSHVEVTFNIIEDIFSKFNHFNFPLYVDLKDKESSSLDSKYLGENRYLLQYSGLPNGVQCRMISPASVTVIRGGVE